MTMEDVIERINNIPVTKHYKDRSGELIGKELTHWVEVKARVLEILKEFEKEKEEKHDE